MSWFKKGNKINLGRKPSKETRLKMSRAQKGRKHTEEAKKKMSEAKKGIVFTEEHREKLSKTKMGKKNFNYGKKRLGRYKTMSGYIVVYMPKHSNSTARGYVMEHRLIMENHVDRHLGSGEVVHHINGIRDDNKIENLMLLPNKSAHSLLHKKMLGKEVNFVSL